MLMTTRLRVGGEQSSLPFGTVEGDEACTTFCDRYRYKVTGGRAKGYRDSEAAALDGVDGPVREAEGLPAK